VIPPGVVFAVCRAGAGADDAGGGDELGAVFRLQAVAWVLKAILLEIGLDRSARGLEGFGIDELVPMADENAGKLRR
jgi:hypothetical protein